MLEMLGYLWPVFGIGAIIAAALNVIYHIKGKDAKWFRFISLCLTALTLCAFHSQDAVWVMKEDWSALEDVLPPIAKVLWILTLCSIALNSISLFGPKKK